MFGTFFLLLGAYTQEYQQFELQVSEALSNNSPFLVWLVFGFANVVFAGIIVAALALVLLIFRSLRTIVEFVPFSMFLLIAAKPGKALVGFFNLPEGTSFLINLLLVLTLSSLIFGSALDWLRVCVKSKRRKRIALPIDEVWAAFAISEHGKENHWEPLLHDVQSVPDEPDSYDVSYMIAPSVSEKQRHVVLNCEAPKSYRYRFSGSTSLRNRELTEGEFEVTLEPDGKGGTYVTAYRHNKAMVPRMALQFWFDDQLGDALDGFAARVRGKLDWSVTGLRQRSVVRLT